MKNNLHITQTTLLLTLSIFICFSSSAMTSSGALEFLEEGLLSFLFFFLTFFFLLLCSFPILPFKKMFFAFSFISFIIHLYWNIKYVFHTYEKSNRYLETDEERTSFFETYWNELGFFYILGYIILVVIYLYLIYSKYYYIKNENR